MARRFRDRTEAGRLLAEALAAYAGRADAVVLGLPRGGVIVAAEIARILAVPLDACLVRKLGAPGHEELAMGAIGAGGVTVLNREIIASLRATDRAIEAETARERIELERRERLYRAGRESLKVKGRAVILVDDGIATGATMLAALRVVKQLEPASLLVAVPVAPPSTLEALAQECDGTVCLMPEEHLVAIGYWYEAFDQTTDAEVQAALRFVPE